ncbi:glycine--tRNA ligase subunit beta [Moraxellaceae bacterium AER2_44_116]|nr:glycine--tRNA ligase subunit beta [Moraxellaceae bacterium]TQC99168.1 glycine--tRNA ligase subunit beta [Moraxellaceae bacterium AER2_44_116]
MTTLPFLVELGCEELPPKSLKILAESFLAGIEAGLKQAGLAYEGARYYAAPRRLAVHIDSLALQQPDRVLTVDGPPVKAAFDANGNPTQAALGFAKKNGIDISEVDRSGEKLRYSRQVKGESATALMTQIINQSLAQLPIAKRMRWGANKVEFVRPVQWLVMLLGSDIVDGEILGFKAGRVSRGHRFHAPAPITLNHANDYLAALKEAYVIADFAERQASILQQVTDLATKENGKALIPPALLDEVTGLVEYPVPLVCSFEERFLHVPQEALISTMQDNQKYFCLVDAKGKLLPRFITVANIQSSNPKFIVEGNEKVVRPRLTDAEFFFKQDQKVKLESRNERLKTVVFQAQLGTVYEKAERISELAAFIAAQIGGDVALAQRAGILSKCDLATEMVGEFPELQGIAGYYYAQHDGEGEEIALALNEQYLPKFAGDVLPTTHSGLAVAIADKLDTLVGIFGINQPPTGSKDPFGLRRAAIGLLRIIIEKELVLDINVLSQQAVNAYGSKLSNANTVNEVFEFLLGRYRAMYEEQNIGVDVIQAVQTLKPTQPLDFDRRIKAVANFRNLAEAEALAAANKRVANILSKDGVTVTGAVDNSLLSEAAEQTLAAQVAKLQAELTPLFAAGDYTSALTALAALRAPIDSFFDTVMVNADDLAIRQNRLNLLASLRALFLAVADISQLQ